MPVNEVSTTLKDISRSAMSVLMASGEAYELTGATNALLSLLAAVETRWQLFEENGESKLTENPYQDINVQALLELARLVSFTISSFLSVCISV
ncbi:unnamed protein product [Echinostoma caproni]|uniref:Histidine kinase n=1 Tax=Echinostoma caproni TaxID=27848 RepID=A0A183BGW7_9TREM|nr:unnamed protein product [Echinostoma caproni]